MSNCGTNNLYIVSFIVGGESGLAFLSAPSEREAISLLRNSGRYNGDPNLYQIEQCRNIGVVTSIRNELLLESYVNALVAYQAILDAANRSKGIPGDKGDPGPAAGFGEVNAEVDANIGIPSVTVTTDGEDTAKNFHFSFHNLLGKTGERGVSISSVEQTRTATTDGGTNEITVTLSDGTTSKVYVKNGETGVSSATAIVDQTSGSPSVNVGFDSGVLSFSFSGIKGIQGEPGMNNTTMRIVELPLPAPSAQTAQDVYLVYNENTGDYDRYITEYDGSVYEWVQAGSLTINLADYERKDDNVWLTQDEFDALEVKDVTKTYNVYEEYEEI